MQSKLKNINFYLESPVTQSLIIHLGIGLSFFLITLFHFSEIPKQVEIQIIEAPKTAPQAIQISSQKPKVIPPPKTQAVFGVSRHSLQSDLGEDVKAGNTVAKTPDTTVLKPDDPDSLPVPTEDYLVTEMPSLAEEVRIPYPPKAKQKGIQGAVVMDILIDSEGRVREVKELSSPDPDLRDAALTAVKNFKFKPGKIQNRTIAVRIRYAYRFVIEH